MRILTRMARQTRFLLPIAALSGLLAPACAQDGRSIPDPSEAAEDRPHATAQLIANQTAATPGGEFLLAVTFDIEEGWHLYWKGKNDTGFPISVDLTLPEGFTAGPTRWPAPVRHVSPGDILDHVYEREVTLLIPISVSDSVPAGGVARFTADADWLVCAEACVPESDKLSLELPIVAASDARPQPSRHARLIKLAHARIPVPLTSQTKGVSAYLNAGSLVVRTESGKEVRFYPFEDCPDLIDPIGGAVAKGASLRVEFVEDPDQTTIHGVIEVVFTNRRLPALYEVTIPRP